METGQIMQAVSQQKRERQAARGSGSARAPRCPSGSNQTENQLQRLKTEVPWILVDHAAVSNGLCLIYNSTILNSKIFALISGK